MRVHVLSVLVACGLWWIGAETTRAQGVKVNVGKSGVNVETAVPRTRPAPRDKLFRARI